MTQPDYIKKLFEAFPNAYINHNNEIIISEVGNVYFRLDDVNTTEECIKKVLAWCSRAACKGMPYNSERYNKKHRAAIRKGCNAFIGKDFSEEDWEDIYAELGNDINPKLSLSFINSGFDFSVLKNKGA